MNIQNTPNAGKRVGPSRYMEIGLTVLVAALLGVSIIGIAYVYGFNLNGNLLDNISAAVRAVGVDGGFFLGLYFSRRHWTREKSGWWDGTKALLAGIPWFAVAMVMAGVSWLSNALFVSGSTTIITQQALDQIGVTFIDAKQANWMIGGIPLVIVLLYSIVPSQVQVKTETRTPEEIEQEAKQEAARIRAQNMVAAARAEGAGQRLRTVAGGLIGQALDLEGRQRRDERLKQMRIAMEQAGYRVRAEMDENTLEVQSVALGVWDQEKDAPMTSFVQQRQELRQWALQRGLLTADDLDKMATMPWPLVTGKYLALQAAWEEAQEEARLLAEELEEEAAAHRATAATRSASGTATVSIPIPPKDRLAQLASKTMLTVAEASELTGRPVRTINAWISAGKITDVTDEKAERDGKRRIPRRVLTRIGWLNKDGMPTRLSNPELAAVGNTASNGFGNGHGKPGTETLADYAPLPVEDESSGLADDTRS